MIRKIIPLLSILALAAILSCSENEAVKPADETTVAPPPTLRTIYVNAKQQATTTSAGSIYYKINSGGWTYLNTISSTICSSRGSFNAYDGDVVSITVVDPVTGLGSGYKTDGYGCNTANIGYCGDLTYGSWWTVTVSGDESVYMNVLVYNSQYVVCS